MTAFVLILVAIIFALAMVVAIMSKSNLETKIQLDEARADVIKARADLDNYKLINQIKKDVKIETESKKEPLKTADTDVDQFNAAYDIMRDIEARR